MTDNIPYSLIPTIIKTNTFNKIQTDTGVFNWSFDEESSITLNGYLPFFAEYLHEGNLFSSWVKDCPLEYKSNNAPEVSDVLGTIMLSVLSGHTRYSHMSSVYGDKASAELLGVNKFVSHDSAERALKKMDNDNADKWIRKHQLKTYEPLLNKPYVLDIDPTVKPIYGNQEGAEIGYNPKKPGRPSHCYHTYIIGTLRLVVDVDVRPGNETAGKYSHSGLWRFLDSLPKSLHPQFIRGDIGFGTNGTMSGCEGRNIPFLFKLKRTSKVKKLLKNLENPNVEWEDAKDGWDGLDTEIKLDGWDNSRRVIVLRRQINKSKLKNKEPESIETSNMIQQEFSLAVLTDKIPEYEYQVLVTSLKDSVIAVAQLYRDRADCENVYDELKNQWGWCGFTTKDMKRTQIMAAIIALIYNWWNIFCRLAEPEEHMEAKTSRPLFFNSVCKIVKTSRQRFIKISVNGSEKKSVMAMFENISSVISNIVLTAPQLSIEQKWAVILTCAFKKFLKNDYLKAVSDGKQLLLL